jgi:hypothetical protein
MLCVVQAMIINATTGQGDRLYQVQAVNYAGLTGTNVSSLLTSNTFNDGSYDQQASVSSICTGTTALQMHLF